MSRFLVVACLAIGLLGLSACETKPAPGDTLAAPEAPACNFDRQNRALNGILKDVESQGAVPAAIRASVLTNAAKLKDIADAANNVQGGLPLGDVACRRVSVLALGALMSIDAQREAVRKQRNDASEKGVGACKNLSQSDRGEGSANACDLFQLYTGVQRAGAGLDRVLRLTKDQPPVTKDLLNEVRASTTDFIASVKDDWKTLPAAGSFAEAIQNEKLSIACPMSAMVQTLMQKGGPDGVSEAARTLSVLNTDLEAAVSASLATTPPGYVAMCSRYVGLVGSPS